MMNDAPIPTEANPYRDVQYMAMVTGFKAATIRGWLRTGRMAGFQIAGEWRMLDSEFVAFLKKEYGDSE